MIALSAWSAASAARVLAAERSAGLRVFIFPEVGHTLASVTEDAAYVQPRLRRGWETLTAWVESAAEPQLILGVESTLATARRGAEAR